MQNQTNTVEICGKIYEVEKFVRLKGKDGKLIEKCFPLVDVPGISDYKWQLMALKSRIEHPELYEKIENVSEAMKDLKMWLLQRTSEFLRLQFQKEYKRCFDFMMQGS